MGERRGCGVAVSVGRAVAVEVAVCVEGFAADAGVTRLACLALHEVNRETVNTTRTNRVMVRSGKHRREELQRTDPKHEKSKQGEYASQES